MDYTVKVDNHSQPYLEVSLEDYQLLGNPLLNKGTAFTNSERSEFNLHGLLPPQESNIIEQRQRSYNTFRNKNTDLEKYIYLRELQDSNETLFYSLLGEHIIEMMPIIYTPGVGDACLHFSHIYRRPRGLFIAYPQREHIDQMLAHQRFNNVKIIVVTDGERILGLGDQGAGGMCISIGKLALYCACSGIHPSETLPIMLDSGTNNASLLQDPLYIGWRHKRITGKDYDDFIAVFVQAVKKRFPHVLLQWEDFALHNASRLLDSYRTELCSFNDDIQGTAAIATATLFAALQVTGIPLAKQYIVIVGAGSAGCGIANLAMHALMEDGLTAEEAKEHIYLVDRNGLLTEGMANLLPFQQKFTKSLALLKHWQLNDQTNISLAEVIHNLHPNALLGVSGQAGLFKEELIREMAAHVVRPIILPLSNPITHCEAVPTDLITWTNNRAIIGTGSPFGNIIRDGELLRIDQTNNAYIFPGIGLGLVAVHAKQVTDKMLMTAARALASCSPAQSNARANLLPPLTNIRELSYKIALAVAKEAINSGVADYLNDEQIEANIQKRIWQPQYLPYHYKK